MDSQKMFVTIPSVPLYIRPSLNSEVYCNIYQGSIVFYNGDFDENYTSQYWSQIFYKTNITNFVGWIPSAFIEPYNISNGDIIKNKTPTSSQSDFEQDIIFLNNVQYNLCAEYCVLFACGWTEFTEDWLDLWKIKSPNIFNRIFYNGRSRPTGIPDIISMLNTFDGFPDKFQTIAEYFKYQDKILFTPKRLKDCLVKNRIICGVQISSQFGRLSFSKGISHWVCIDNIELESRGGSILLYNPASNSLEKYNWDRFILSVGSSIPFGLIIPRD